MMRELSAVVFLAAGLALSGCASDDPTGVNDPYEQTNRSVFEMNQKVDRAVLLPSAKFYVEVVPKPARDGLHNVLTNLDLPITFANDVLQGEFSRAGDTVTRFGVNSTIGMAGLFDVATKWGVPYHSEDFGQTLGTWGVGEGPYMVLPFLGPDPPRDAAGQVVDVFLDPTTYIKIRAHLWWSVARESTTVLDLRSRNIDTMDSIERTSVDYYATVRSLYRQARDAEIRNGKTNVQDLPNF
jgi:phospholipid-binding lipoprotein MlaA